MSRAGALPADLVDGFRARMARDRARLARLRQALAAAEAPALSGDPHRIELEQLAHGLVGSGTTFGFTEVTAAAEDVERLTGLHPDLIASAEREARHLVLLAIDRLHLALAQGQDASAPA